MKLEYKVLCIDDNLDTLQSVKRNFSRFNDDVGIKVKFVDINASMAARDKPEDLKERIESEIGRAFKENNFDLVIVDLHMTGDKGGLDGPDIIQFIRNEQTIYRPIAFYSAGDPAQDGKAKQQLYEAAEKAEIFGKSIFITTRNDLSDLLQRIAGEMHKYEHQINQVRGMLMDHVSEIDAEVIKIISNKTIWEKIHEDQQEKILKEFKKLIKSQCEKSTKRNEEVSNMTFKGIVDYILKDPKNTGTFEKAKLLREIARYIPDISYNGAVFSEFLNDKKDAQELKDKSLNTIRNHYAHIIAQELSVGHSDDLCIHIRKQSHNHAENIASIKEKV